MEIIKKAEYNLESNLTDFESQFVCAIKVNHTLVGKIIPDLFLLKEGLVETLSVKLVDCVLFLQKSKDIESRCTEMNLDAMKFRLFISNNTLEYLLFYLLKYYRDFQAESEHIDIDFQNEMKEFTLTIHSEMYLEYAFKEFPR